MSSQNNKTDRDPENNPGYGPAKAGATDPDLAASRQTTLVYLLFSLHILFGITALIGVIICHSKKQITKHTVFNSHRVWQIWTFWTAAVGYIAGFYYWQTMGTINILLLTFAWVYYRIASGWWKARAYKSVGIGSLTRED